MNIAQFDMFKGEQITEHLYNFNITEPVSDHFNQFKIETMNVLVNLGSVLTPILLLMIAILLFYKIAFWIAKLNFRTENWRLIGIRA